MKTHIYILMLSLFIFCSCESMLDVNPDNTIVEKDLFSEGTGYENSLNGIYKNLASNQLYGRELSFGFAEALSNNYLYKRGGFNIHSSYYDVCQFKYTDNEKTKSMINSIWINSYKIIANTNNLIRNIDKEPVTKFKKGKTEKNLIKGEALAIRAMMHFDILRLFAPSIKSNDNGNYISYVTTFPYYGGQKTENVENILTKIERDFILARENIASYDTLTLENRDLLGSYTRWTMSISSSDASNYFFFNRGYRMNYLAVTAILARVYNYWGKYDKAKQLAEEVIDFTTDGKKDGYHALKFTSGWGMNKDKKFSDDLIFALSYPKLVSTYSAYKSGHTGYTMVLNKKRVVFKGGNSDGGDYRLKYLVDTESDWYGYIPLKNVPIEGEDDDKVSIIKLSEMYFIISEYYANQGDFTDALKYINDQRAGRNCQEIKDVPQNMDEYLDILFEEVGREFFGEGQTFLYYKKYNKLIHDNMKVESFVIPVPDSETIN